MDEDDLPPEPASDRDEGFFGELGRGFSAVLVIALFFAIAGVALYAALHWWG
jgi:hypothetical protein